MIKLKIIAIFAVLWPIVMGHIKTDPTICVQTSLGEVKGRQMESRLGEKFWAFLGVRYAEPPVGELRFQNPQPVKAWRPKIYDATKDGPICPQETVNLTYLSEDCLRLNVYTKDVRQRKPVIVYLHTGGFFVEGAITLYAGPENFMDRDIVLVTINYRLGSLGFLATGTSEAAGNMGLKDQVIALRWVQQHIENFGGDPNSVTLLGYSAGSWSIGLHVVSPMTKGLFHRGIMMSGNPLSTFKYQTNQLDLAERQARLLNCPVKPIKEMVKCLKRKPMMDFVNTTKAMFEFDYIPLPNWLPVIEQDCGGNQERYLIEDPYTLTYNGNIHKVPLIIGMNEFEFYFWSYDALRNETIRNWFNEDIYARLPTNLLYERDTPKSREITTALRSHYFQNKTLENPGSLKSFADIFMDSLICVNFRYFQMVSKFTSVYTYIFTYKGRYSYYVDPETNKTRGPVHQDELLYLFNSPLLTPLFKKNDPENDTIERLTRLWFEFAKKGNPNNVSDKYLNAANWPLYSDETKLYLEIGDNLNVKSDAHYRERYKAWDSILPIRELLNPLQEQQCKI
ncbi:juvenile hormone esterase-like [Cochliomyia hominivorax]